MESTQCLSCKHYLGVFKNGMHCNAFPLESSKTIPSEIFTGLFDHRIKHPDDNGVLWEKDENFINDFGDEDIITDMSDQPLQ